MVSRKIVVGMLALMAAGASSAQATDLLSFSFSDLLSSYDSGSSLLGITNDDNTDGELTRLVPVMNDAFFAGADGSFDIGMTISAVTDEAAFGVGTIAFTDADGDIFSGDLTGNWVNVNGSANFVGQIMNFMPDSSGGNGSFDGTVSGSFDMDLGVAPPFSGNIITLVFGSWFNDGNGIDSDGIGNPASFEAPTTEAIGAIVPEPGTLALLAIGALIAGRRRS